MLRRHSKALEIRHRRLRVRCGEGQGRVFLDKQKLLQQRRAFDEYGSLPQNRPSWQGARQGYEPQNVYARPEFFKQTRKKKTLPSEGVQRTEGNTSRYRNKA